MGRLQDKVAVITGGASGIGFAAARLMAREGASVMIGDLDEDAATKAAEAIVADGGESSGMAVDAMSEESITALVAAAVEKYGALHVMCNHVGGSNPKKDLDLLRLDMTEFDRIMQLNVRSTVVGSRAALPHLMAAGGGSIINTASVGGLSGDFLQVGYGTAKAALAHHTRLTALDLNHHPQRVLDLSRESGTRSAISPALVEGCGECDVRSTRAPHPC